MRPSRHEAGENRVARKRAARRRLVEHTAADLFAERRYDGAGFDEIGARLDLRGPSLYHYYSSKEELFLRTVENGHAEVLDRLRVIVARDLPAEERLRLLFVEQAIIEFRDFRAFASLFLMSVPVPAIAARLAELRREHGQVFRALAGEVAEQHGVPARRAGIAVLLALGALGNLHSWYRADGPLSLEAIAAEVADILLQPFLGAE
ncbi:TetR/AcrR family transcriptional regulator [Pseudonocardia sp. ICBG1293]|uniref:TetR/AcrR family transcriptional regulator n=1 Tax=Pseudonocardia sp. ICBG1293 TaxID=2844382 RepID=UPI001CC8F358|nr:TetR/AcrR family transcriptional regulator [Pseudonocardia sp. ICBG1293]